MRKCSAFFLALILVLSLAVPGVGAEPAQQYQYATASNSGQRHELCTTLEGTGADDYYTGSYTFDLLSRQTGDQLLQQLRTLMKTTHTRNASYSDCRDMAAKTDCENNDGRIVTIYTSYSATFDQYKSGTGWNREHVWPKSLGGFETSGAGADMHHIRPSENRTNSTRGNKKYGEVSGSKQATGNLSGLVGGTYDGTYFEPVDNVKGDVARICLYVYVRYGGELSQCSKITNVFQSVDVLLQWCALDPVDTWEMGRNEVVAAFQGNRNVFVDYPEYAWLIFGREVPEDLVTPTSQSRENTACGHSHTQLRNQKAATCTEAGYTGDTYCTDCQKQLQSGTAIPAAGHSFGQWTTVQEPTEQAPGLQRCSCTVCGATQEQEIPKLEVCQHGNTEVQNKTDATCTEAGYTGDTYCTDCQTQLQSGTAIPALGHSFGQWTTVKESTKRETGLRQRSCTLCGAAEQEELPKLESGQESWIYIVIAAAAVVAVTVVVIVKKKK